MGKNLIKGDEKDNHLNGTSKDDEFDLQQGGDDTVKSSEGSDTVWGSSDSNNTMDYTNKKDSGIEATVEGFQTRVLKGPFATDTIGPKPQDSLKNMNILKATDRADEINVHKIEGEMYIDGRGEGVSDADVLNIDLAGWGGNTTSGAELPNPKEFVFIRENGKFSEQPYNAKIMDGNGNILHINGFEDININGKPADIGEVIEQNISNASNLFSQNNSEATFGNATAEAKSYTLPITDTFAMLDKVKSMLNESGIDSELREIVNHDGAVEMLDNLKEDGLDLLEVPGHEDQSPEEQIEAVLLAAHDATIERGLDMPGESQDNSNTNSEHGYSNADDDYSIV